jgi:TnpA family transposase
VQYVPVEFLSDQEAAAFGRYGGSVPLADLERFFYLDDADRKLVAGQREDHNRLGFSIQLVTVRYIGKFLADPLDGVPAEVIDFLAGQLQIADPSCLKRYSVREPTHREHAAKIQKALALKDFAEVEGELAVFAGRRAWVTGDGPKVIFADAVRWLRERDVLLPGVSRLARLVARERDAATQRLRDSLYAALTGQQRAALDALLEVPPGSRVSELERWRAGPARASGPQMVRALNRVAEIIGSGLSRVQLDASVTPRRLAELARYGMGTDVAQLKRHGDQRRMATLVATVTQLEATATDDALELLELLMATELIGRARQEAGTETIRRHPRLARASAMLAVVAQVLLEARDWGSEREVRVWEVWEAIEARIPRAEVRAAVDTVTGMLPPPEALPEPDWRAELAKKTHAVVGLCKMLTATITFGASAQGAPALAAMTALGEQLATDTRWTARNPRIHPQVVTGPWKHLVFGHPARDDGTVDRGAYIFCMLEQFCRHLKHREIYAESSTRYRNPQARLLDGAEWEAVKDDVLTTLGLPEDPGALLASHVTALDEALRYVGGRLAANADVRVDEAGRIHVTSDKAIAEPPSLVDLRKRVAAMLPRVDIGEQILEVMGWVPQFLKSLTALSGGAARMADLNVTVAAALTGQALNIGYGPVSSPGVPALERRRIGHVGRTYLRAAGYTAANPHLIAQQAGIGFAQALGGGMVAAIDGMRFVVPVPSLMAKPNRKYFGPKRGMTFLNMINDQAFGTGHKIVAGTDRDCLHAIDLFFSPGVAHLPEVLVTDTGSYSDLIFGIASLLGVDYRPALADLPDQKGWRAGNGADYGSLNTFARGKLDLGKVRRHWGEILRLIATIYTSKVSASDVVRALQRDGHPTALAEAIATYGRIFKTLHILSIIDSPPYRRGIKGMRNLQEGRHALAEKIFHGRRRELFQRYREGMEDQLGALGIVLNCVVLWNTVYIDAALSRLRAQGYPIRDEDVARLSPFMRNHVNVHGKYSFTAVEPPGPGKGASATRQLRDPDARDDEDDFDEDDSW